MSRQNCIGADVKILQMIYVIQDFVSDAGDLSLETASACRLTFSGYPCDPHC